MTINTWKNKSLVHLFSTDDISRLFKTPLWTKTLPEVRPLVHRRDCTQLIGTCLDLEHLCTNRKNSIGLHQISEGIPGVTVFYDDVRIVSKTFV